MNKSESQRLTEFEHREHPAYDAPDLIPFLPRWVWVVAAVAFCLGALGTVLVLV